MEQPTVNTYTATIYLGFKNAHDNITHSDTMANDICRVYCDKVGLCVTITSTQFVYTGGCEPGCIIGLINYPRFPSEPLIILMRAIELAKLLKTAYKQCRVTIITPDKTIMLSGEIK